MDVIYEEELISQDIKVRLRSLLETNEIIKSPNIVPENYVEPLVDTAEVKVDLMPANPMKIEEEKVVTVENSSDGVKITLPVLGVCNNIRSTY